MKRIAEPVVTEELCFYGCGQVAKYRNGSGKLMCCERHNSCPELRKKNGAGVKSSGRDYSKTYDELPQETKDRMAWNRGNYSADFSLNGRGSHKNVLIKERGHVCECCGMKEWLGVDIPLELEHIDGNNRNNVKDNLKLLCPNCHALTETWRGRNTNLGRKFVSDDDLYDALVETEFVVHPALIKVGMTPKGSNYTRCYELIMQRKIAPVVKE